MDNELLIKELGSGILSPDAIRAIGLDVSYYLLYEALSPEAQAISRLKIADYLREKARLEALQ